MPISKDLFLAILSMDAYNRGYDAGIGSATDGLGSAPGTRIGSAVIKDIDLPVGSEAAGFYALAYDWNGETVISYRGTNDWGELPLVDLPIFTGDYDEDQIYFASQFYNQVSIAAGENSAITLTGHCARS